MASSSIVSGFQTGLGSAVLQFTLERFATIGSFLWKEISIVLGVEDELRKLQRTFLKIEDLVHRVESRNLRFSNASKAWQIWYEDLKKLAYDADALLDHVSLHISTYNHTNVHSVTAYEKDKVRNMILSPQQFNLPRKINQMQKNLQDLANEMESLMSIEKVDFNFLKHKTEERSHSRASYVNMTSLLVDEGAIVGRKDDKEKFIIKLLSDNKDLSVIPLVGMGGVGKTTLARLVYNDRNVCQDFKLKIWISVSMDLDVLKITKEVIEIVTKQSCALSDFNSLQLRLQEILASSEKFLLVLDDYWSENDDEWELLSSPFRSACEGSKIIVTTRSIRVANIVGSVEAYNLETLSDEDCWSLMKQRAFHKKKVNKDFESLGRDIAKKCKGLPLAAVTIGSVLHRQTTEDEWDSIWRSELWDLPQDQNGIYPSLMLSYLHLPPNLQRCFAYCSIFPQNHEFKVENLVLLWMAEGFIQPIGVRRLEDIGSAYFNDLHLRSLFLVEKNSSNQTIYKMHDLIHDLTRLVSADTCAQVEHDTYPLFGNACHLSLHHNNVQSLELKATHKNERLRTFLVMSKNGVAKGLVDQKLFYNLKFVRTLVLTNIGLSNLPDSIEHLIYLRHLNLSQNDIQTLPKSICNLLALQSFMLLENPQLNTLPSDMKNLLNLRHLYFDINGRLSSMPKQFGNLTNLQTLSAFLVTERKGQTIKELAHMNSLRGSLTIKNLHNVSIEADAMEAKLDMKQHLNKLCLLWDDLRNPEREVQEHQVMVLTNLQPHKNLKELTMKNYSGVICPKWLSDSQCKFTRIHLHGLNYCDILPSFGQLPLLKSLCIGEMSSLKSIDQTFYGYADSSMSFPLLEFLDIYKMAELVSWNPTRNIVSMPNLITFKLDDCPKLTNLPSNLRSLSNSNINGCPRLP